MLKDLYGLDITTASTVARDAYVEGCRKALTFYPGAIEAYDRAIAADPCFAMAHAGKAQILLRQAEPVAAREALAKAEALSAKTTDREASHIAFFGRVFSGQTEAALAAVFTHLSQWPLDALVVNTAANPNGVIGGSGHVGQKRRIAALMDALAPHYGGDAWFVSYHAMALSEDGRLAAARALGMAEVPVVVLDHLSPEQRRAYVIADNKLAENAGWDLSKLDAELRGLMAADFDLSSMGFSDDELRRLEDGLELGQFEQLSQGYERAEPEQQPGLGMMPGAGEDDGPEDATAESGEVEERHVFSCNLLWDDREVVLAAVRLAKEKHGLEGTPEALVQVCREWMDG